MGMYVEDNPLTTGEDRNCFLKPFETGKSNARAFQSTRPPTHEFLFRILRQPQPQNPYFFKPFNTDKFILLTRF